MYKTILRSLVDYDSKKFNVIVDMFLVSLDIRQNFIRTEWNCQEGKALRLPFSEGFLNYW